MRAYSIQSAGPSAKKPSSCENGTPAHMSAALHEKQIVELRKQ